MARRYAAPLNLKISADILSCVSLMVILRQTFDSLPAGPVLQFYAIPYSIISCNRAEVAVDVILGVAMGIFDVGLNDRLNRFWRFMTGSLCDG